MDSTALSVPRQLSDRDQAKLLRRTVTVLQGVQSVTPTPSILRVADVGLLYFLNQKQAQLHAIVAMVDLAAHPALRPVQALVEFTSFIVGGLIVEAERVDEATITVRKELARLGAELRNADLDLQYRHEHVGTSVSQIIAQHYKTHLSVPQKHHRNDRVVVEQHRYDAGGGQSLLGELPELINTLRGQVKVLRAHLTALTTIQKLLHGNGARMPEAEAAAIVTELDVVATFRKALHKFKDAVYDVPERQSLTAVDSISEFVAYLDCGLTAAMDELLLATRTVKKSLLGHDNTTLVGQLSAADARNKQLSTDALRMNEALSRSDAFTRSAVRTASGTPVGAAVPAVTPRQPPVPIAPSAGPIPPGPPPANPFATAPALPPAAAAGGVASDVDAFLQQWCA